jgi:hypothetical protein
LDGRAPSQSKISAEADEQNKSKGYLCMAQAKQIIPHTFGITNNEQAIILAETLSAIQLSCLHASHDLILLLRSSSSTCCFGIPETELTNLCFSSICAAKDCRISVYGIESI